MKRIDHAEASSKFIKAKDHLDFHDKRLWDLRKKRDRVSEQLPGVGGAALAGVGDQGAHADASWRLSGGVRAQRDRERRAGPLGEGRRRAQPDRVRHPERAQRANAGQGQVDAHRRVRHAAVPRESRHRGHGDGSGRAHPAARRRAAEPHRRARGPQAANRRGAGVFRHHRHRPARTATSTISRRASASTRGPTFSRPTRA